MDPVRIVGISGMCGLSSPSYQAPPGLLATPSTLLPSPVIHTVIVTVAGYEEAASLVLSCFSYRRPASRGHRAEAPATGLDLICQALLAIRLR
jgi:hypothetical protein